MPCLDLCVLHVYFHAIWILVSTCLYAWIHVLPCLCAKFLHVHMYVSMLICLDLCSHMSMCLDLCSLHALCYLPCACALHAMFVCLDPGYVCHVMCYCNTFVPFIAFSCVLAYWFGPDLDPMVSVIFHTPRPTSKGFRPPLFACLCLLASMFYAYVSLSSFRLCHACRPWRVVVMWLHSTPIRPCLNVTTWDASPWCRLLRAYLSPFLLRSMLCLPCLFVPPVGFLCIFTRLFTCPCMSLVC